jgi:phosphohistidine phosphatase
MRILFVRHAVAVERDEYTGADMDRPLTPGGKKEATTAFDALAKRMKAPDRIVSSEAVRAVETADLLARAFRLKGFHRSPHLNPGATVKNLRSVLKAAGSSFDGTMAVVGHEPDLSEIVSVIVAKGQLALKLRKAGCVLVEMDTRRRGTLLWAAPPSLLAAQVTRSS